MLNSNQQIMSPTVLGINLPQRFSLGRTTSLAQASALSVPAASVNAMLQCSSANIDQPFHCAVRLHLEYLSSAPILIASPCIAS